MLWEELAKCYPSQRDYSIILLDGTKITHHHSDIVSALATKTSSDVTLIDPFQLIDWKDRTPPDHLYPKFKVFMDKFKEQHPPNQSDVNHQGAKEQKATDNDEVETHQQEPQQDSADSESAELNALWKLVLDPNTQSHLLTNQSP